jgi:beta-phosphoglucomutase-like phosphatase (HAD superfamily)
MAHEDVSFIFDLDGTLVDSVYQQVMAWQEALQSTSIFRCGTFIAVSE